MGAAPFRPRPTTLLVAALLLLTAAAGCSSSVEQPEAAEPAAQTAPHHPIQPSPWNWSVPSSDSSTTDGSETKALSPGPNATISRTPRLQDRLAPADRVQIPSARGEIEATQKQLQEQHQQQIRKLNRPPGAPAGTIDLRPGTIHPHPGTIEIPE